MVLASLLPLAQSASAGTTSGDALAQAATVFLDFSAPNIDFLGGTQLQGVGPDIGSQTFPGSFDISDPNSMGSSAVASSGSVTVDRTTTGVGASATVEGLELTLLGETLVSATSITSSVTCPAGDVVNIPAAQATGVRVGDAAPVDLSAGQGATGSTTITDGGQTYSVGVQASVFATAAQDASAGFVVIVTIGSEFGTANFAMTSCDKLPGAEPPGPEPEPPGPEPDDGLAESGTDTALVAALLGVVLVAGGGSVLLWSRAGRRISRRD